MTRQASEPWPCFPAAAKGKHGPQNEQGRERLLNRSDIRDGFHVNGMKSEEQPRGPRHPSVSRKPEAETVNQIGHRDMRQHRSEVPSPGVEPKKRIVQAQPSQEEWPVIIGEQVRVAKTPNVRGKVAGEIAPGANRVIGDDQNVIVKNKPQGERGHVTEEGRGQDRRRQQGARPTGVTSVMPLPCNLLRSILGTHG